MTTPTIVKTRGSELWLGTKADNHLTDSYTQVPGSVTWQGNVGPQWSEMDVTELTHTDAQIEKNLRNLGRLTFTGNLHQEVASGSVAGLVALEAAANDGVPGNYNIMLVKSNGRRKYLKVGVFQFQETYGSGGNVNGFTCLVIVRAVPGETAPDGLAVPENVVLPAIAGLPVDGETFHGWEGLWAGAVAHFSYQYQVDDDGWENIDAATAKQWLVSGVTGKQVRLGVTATNAAGSATAYSAPTAEVASAD